MTSMDLPPNLCSSSEERDSSKARRRRGLADDAQDSHRPWCSLPRGLHLHLRWLSISRLQVKAGGPDFHVELFPLHSPLLKESHLVSHPPLTYMLKFIGWSSLASCRFASGGFRWRIALVSSDNKRGARVRSLSGRRGEHLQLGTSLASRSHNAEGAHKRALPLEQGWRRR